MTGASIHDFVRARLLRAAERSGISNAELALRSGVNERSIERFWAGQGWRSATVERLSRALGVHWP